MDPSNDPNGTKVQGSPFAESQLNDVNSTGALSQPSGTLEGDNYAGIADEEAAMKERFEAAAGGKSRGRVLKFAALGTVLVVGVVLLAFRQLHSSNTGTTTAADASVRYNNVSIPLADLNTDSPALSVGKTQTLSINGQLNVNNSLVLAPTSRPDGALTGQLYYDQATNKLAYYDGSSFQNVLTGDNLVTTTIGGTSGAIATGSGLTVAGSTLSNTGVLSLQGQSGNITLAAGPGIVVNGTTLSNSGLLSLGGQNGAITLGAGLGLTGSQLRNTGIISAVGTGTISVSNDGNGNITINSTGGSGSGTVASPGGTSGKIAKFTGVQTIADSLISDNGTVVTVGGDLTVTGTLSLPNNPLAVTSGGTGANTAAGARTNLGAAKSGANSDITSLSGLTTALSVAQGGTGIGTLATNGVILGNGTSPLTSVVAGSAGQCLVSTAGAPIWTACPGSGGVSSLNGGTGALTLNNASLSGSTITINDATTAAKGIASFNGANFNVTSGAVNTIQNIGTSAAPTFGQLTLTSSQAANPMFVVNNTNVAASGALLDLQLNGASKFSVSPGGNITSAGTLNGQTISSSASFTGTLAVTGAINGQTISNAANFTGSVAIGTTLTVNTVTPTSSLTVGSTGQSFLLQGNASSTFTATSGANKTTLAFQTPTANVTYSFPTAASNGAYDICTTVGNCAGVGGGVTTPGGTANTIAKFTAGGTIGNSSITDNGTTVTVGGALSVNTITPISTLTIGATSQSLTLQGATVNLTSTASGVTNSLTFATPSGANKTITIPNATGTLAVSASGPLALDSAGNLTCPTCLTSGGSGGTAGVASLNGLTGALTINNATGSGSAITLNDATTGAKGIASFNATNFNVTAGAVNTIQDIATSAAPTFGQLTITSSQAANAMMVINNTNVGATGNLIDLKLNGSSKFSVAPSGNTTIAGTLSVNTVTPTAALTVGTAGQSFTLQGSGSSIITSTANGHTTTVGFTGGSPTTDPTYKFDSSAPSGTYNVCTTAAVCTGYAASAGSGNYIQNQASTPQGASFFIQSVNVGDVTGVLRMRSGQTADIFQVQAVSGNPIFQIAANANLTTLTDNLLIKGQDSTPAALVVQSNDFSGNNPVLDIQRKNSFSVARFDADGNLYLGNMAQNIPGSLFIGQGSNGFGVIDASGLTGGNHTLHIPDEDGTICVWNSTNCGFVRLAPGSVQSDASANPSIFINDTGGGNLLQLQSNMTDQLILTNGGALQAASLDTITVGGTLGVGGANASTINVKVGGATVASFNGSGYATFKPANDNTQTFDVQNAAGSDILRIDSNSMTTTVKAFQVASSYSINVINGGITIGGNTMVNFRTPGLAGDGSNGSDIPTKINVPLFDPGNFGQIIALGLPSSANTNARAITLLDARTTAHQPTINVISPNEQEAFGFTWNGSNSLPLVYTSAGKLGFGVGGGTPASIDSSNVGLTQLVVGIAGPGGKDGALTLGNASNSNQVSLLTGTTSSSYTIKLPAAIGSSGNCLNIAGVVGSVETLGYTSCGLGGGSVFLQGGNSFGATGVLGTTDNNALTIITNNATRATFAADGSSLTLGSNTNLLLQGSSAHISNTQGQTNSEAFGSNAAVTGVNALAAGNGASAAATAVAVGGQASGTGSSTVVVGYQATANSSKGIAIGAGAFNSSTASTVIGTNATAASHDYSIALGYSAATTAANQLVIGGDDGASHGAISQVVIGNGVTNAAPVGFTLQATSTITGTTNVAGGSITIAGGQGTGTGNGGNINFQIAKAGTTGSSQNALSTVASINGANGSALFKNAADSSTAFQIQNAAGSNTVMNVDTTNGQLTLANIGSTINTSANLIIKRSTNALVGTQQINFTNAAGTTGYGGINLNGQGDLFFGGGDPVFYTGTTGQNTAVGQSSLGNIISGSYNTAVGGSSLLNVSSGASNTGVGSSALNLMTTGNGNTGVGNRAFYGAALGSGNDVNTAIGNGAGSIQQTIGANFYANTFIGQGSGGQDQDNFQTSGNIHESTAIGSNAEVQASNTIVLGRIDIPSQVVIGSTMPTGTNTLGVSATIYKAGTASQSGNTVTGVSTTWNAANGVKVGMRLIFANGTDAGTITAIGSTTSLTVSISQTVSSQNYRIVNTGFQVTNTGDAYLSSTSTTAFRIQDATGSSVLTADTSARGASGGNLIKIGDSTGTDSALTLLQLDSTTADPTSNLSALNGSLFYNSTTNKVSLIENGQVKIICNTTDLGCGTGTVKLQDAYFNSTGGTTPEVLLDATRKGVDIQDANSTIGASQALFAVRGSATASTLGTAYFQVLGDGHVGVNGTSANYQLNVTGSSTSTGALNLQGANGTGTTSGGAALTAVGGNGGNTAGAGSSAGSGGGISLTGGNGGDSTLYFGGLGGGISLVGGNGGMSSSGIASQAGSGGSINLQGGTGGAVGSLTTGGAAGNVNITGGTGGPFLAGGNVNISGGGPGGFGPNYGDVILWGANIYVKGNTATAFQVQDQSNNALLTVSAISTSIIFGNSGNTITFTPAGGLVAAGTARHTKTILLTPEYAGGVLDALGDASCSSAFNGTMTSGYDSTNRMNYYDWTTAQGTAQCYDVIAQVPIPSDFSAWSGNPDIEMQKDSTGTAAYAIQIVPSSGSDANYGSFAVHNTLTTSWSNMANNPLSGTYTAGDYLTIKIRMTSTSGANVKLGNIKLQYLSGF